MLEQRQRPSVFIKDMTPKRPEEKNYYILVCYPEDDERENTWILVEGQSEAARMAKTYILDGCDLDNSKVLVSPYENQISGMVSIYWFMYKMQGIYPELEMDIESFASGDPIEVTKAAEIARVNPQVSITKEDNEYTEKDV